MIGYTTINLVIDAVSWIIYIVGVIWIIIDTKKVGIKKGIINGLGNMGRTVWIVATILFWIIAIPLYIFQRKTIIERLNITEEKIKDASLSYVILSLWMLYLIMLIVVAYFTGRFQI